MAESFSREKPDNVINDDDMIKFASNEIIRFLDLDDNERKDQIVKELLESGRQSLTKYEEDLMPKTYSAAMNGNDNELMKSLKKYFEQQWKAQYNSNEWIMLFLKQYQDDENYQCVLNRTAEYGNKYMKNCPILSIILQLLFEGIDDKCLNESNIFNDLWFTITNYGLNSIGKYSDYITKNLLNKIIKKEQPLLFQALREFYCPELFKLLKETNIKDKENLYELVLNNVVENGWLTGLEASRDNIIPKYFKILLTKMPSSQKQPVKQESDPTPIQTPIPTPVQALIPTPVQAPVPTPVSTSSFGNVTLDEKEKKRLYLEDLRRDLANMPSCAEKSIMELLACFEDKLAKGHMYSQEDGTVASLLQKLQNQINKEELFSEKILLNFQDLERYVCNYDVPLIVRTLGELLTKIRPLHVQEIQRLVEKAKDAGKLIRDKEIILLIGQTGTGKSTTIQFLAGSKMKETKVEVEPGRFLDHITVDGLITNPGLKNVTSSARNKSETRYIAPVTIQLKDVFGSCEFGEVILCDAPGFDDTAGPEVDIANGVGVIEAIKGCRSVKILALSSYKSLGDRGQGIQKLAHLLINMVHGIQDRLSAILYAFTKYPPNIDISALLIDIKISKVDTDPLLLSDSAFLTVLADMIKKTDGGAEKIDPIRGDRKCTIEKLKKINGIMYPEDCFRFLMSEETQACVANQAQRDNSTIRCALKHKDIGIVMYYLNRLKTLKNLLEHSTARDVYEDAVRFINESIEDYCTGVTTKFNRFLASQDGLEQRDVDEYKMSIEYIQEIQKLTEHLGSKLRSPESLMQNIHSELQERGDTLTKEDLYSPLVGIYFHNLCILKNTFKQLELFYNKTCDSFRESFEKLEESSSEPISKNKFDNVAEIILKIWKCLPILNIHLQGLVEKSYKKVVQSLLQHLNSFYEEINRILVKMRLSESDVKKITDCVEKLISAKENSALQDRVSTYIEMLKKKNDESAQNVKSTSYGAAIEKIVEYFNQRNNRILELFQTNGDRALEDVETLINEIDLIRTIPEIESKTAGAYYRTVGIINGYMHQLQRDIEQLLFSIDHQSGTPNYGRIARLVSRLKNAKWMNRVSPGAYDVSINRVTEELVQYFHQLADSLMKLDLSLKYPENVCIAEGIFDKIESLSILERSIPELKNSKDAMNKRFLESVQGNFNRIQEKFKLQDNIVYKMKQNLKELEQIKREYDNLHSAHILLRDNGYSDINKLNSEIDELEKKQNAEVEQENEEKTTHNTSLSSLKSIKKQYESLLETSDSISPEQINFLKEKGFDNIQLLIKKIDEQKIEIIEEKKNIIAEQQNSKQSYNFGHGFDAATADIALLYTSNCGKIANIRLKEIAADTYEILKKYISEYGFFLHQEIKRLFKELTTNSSQENLLQYSEDLETRLEQLSSLREFKCVFECIEGTKKVEHWRGKFSKQHRNMSSLMEEYKISGKTQDLKNQLTIAQGLMGSDHFYGDTFLSNGFAALYKKYQIELTTESKQAYETLQSCISEGDYAKIGLALADIDEKTSNPKEINLIKYSLQQCLNTLIQSTRRTVHGLDPKVDFKENNESKIREINENIEKIRTVLTQPKIMGLIHENTKSHLIDFEKSIETLLSDMLLKGLKSIEDFMNSDDIFEAEQSMENLSPIEHELTNHFTMENVIEKASNVRESLNNLPDNIKQQNDFKKIENYSKKPPKDLLPKLEKAASYLPRKYTNVVSSIKADINEYFEEAIGIACNAPIEKRSAQMSLLKNALRFLPESFEKKFKPRIDELLTKFTEEEKEYKRDLKGYLEKETVNDSTIKRMGELVLQYKQENRDEPLEMLRAGIIDKLDNLSQNVQNALDTEDIQSAINKMRQIIKYKEYVDSIPQVDEFYKRVCTLTSTNVMNYMETLNNMFKIEKTEIVDQAFSNVIAFIELGEEFPQRIHELLPEKVLQQVEIGLKNLHDNWQNISKTFHTAMTELNIKSLREVTSTMERWDGFLNKIRNCSYRHDIIQKFLNGMKNIKLYSEMMNELRKKISDLRQNLDVKLITDETRRFDATRDQFFNKLATYLKALKSIDAEFKNILLSETDIKNLEKEFQEKVEDIKKKLLTSVPTDEPTPSESDNFRMYYNHLVSLDKYINLPDAKIQDTLELAEIKIFEKVMSLSKDIANVSFDVPKVAKLLVKMKFFAENFSMFDTKINGIIDDVLKAYKTQHGSMIISQLTMALEATDEGSRIIAEHSCLSGEDWRKRREKMQNQDNLEYVIGDLEGDDIATDVLCSRYKAFRRTYNDLISKILGSFDPKTAAEPDVEVLITQTKVLIGTVTQNTNDVTWNHSFRDRIPDLLAHIFAIWTLKNTQHYNAMRGIDASQAYLLMPHVAQVIAIFRILGIGYKKNSTLMGIKIPFIKRISDDLVNNLVQIGTGEGKSVVMAISACVFALVGVDVNCSCYSEYLSMRDKNDFASVFRALGIEDRIEYGTFNKLCENLLNEQCNVREKVRDMIMNNKSVIDVVQTTARIRPKVLLIDEVDVFLSEKYYGGIYTPSVCLKDSTIKTLLDTLWKNRNIRTLTAVKALPAYKACATRFSNWTFLFDEAIKDMLTALQSFQSTTYIVQNDKIVYVEGESIAENVVRGYDTIWAYYFENQKGFISSSSLENNVGIIINCGTFSYAEMPHEFAYIAGVTGTLKTLAQPEKNILKDGYQIHQNTYMPSVFGKSNRNYNSTNDVQAVNESEYFMNILGQIRTMCDAKRAILVFFESEEKLIEFYNSSQLSPIKQNVQIITEKVSAKERELCIKRAATNGRVTLLTRTFGRGTDFICRNQQVLANGGVHVLQTFFSEELSEEYQIMGRGARQGDSGSYRMILLDSDLEWVLGADWKEKLPNITGTALYAALDKARNTLYESKCAAKEVGIEQCRQEHQYSKSFMTALSEGKMDLVQRFLYEQNHGANVDSEISRTLLLMDATGSMSNLLSATKDTVCTMFERASAVLEEKGLSKDAFSMQFAVYRNYNSKENKILEVSSWETKASHLRTFMNRIGPEGGWGNEAIEIGLSHAVQESGTQDGFSQVILIGDAPANTKDEVAHKRTQLSEAYWKKTRFDTPTYYEDELQKLIRKNIPVHAFYLTKLAKTNFEKIASETEGRCEFLNIFSPDGAALLTDFVTEEVLRKAAGAQGDSAVELYRKKYGKKTFTS